MGLHRVASRSRAVAAICLLTSPSASSARICASRAVSASGAAAARRPWLGAHRPARQPAARPVPPPPPRPPRRSRPRWRSAGAPPARRRARRAPPSRGGARRPGSRAPAPARPSPAGSARRGTSAPRSISASTTCAAVSSSRRRASASEGLPPPTATWPRLASSASSPARSRSDSATTSTRITRRAPLRLDPGAQSLAHEALDHVGRHGDAESAHDHRVDADDPARAVGQRPAGVAGRQPDVGVQPAGGPAHRAGRAVDHAERRRVGHAEADGPSATSSSPGRRPRASARRRGLEIRRGDRQHGEIPTRIARDHPAASSRRRAARRRPAARRPRGRW